jgi:transposase
MSMQPRPWPEVPEMTARVARAAFPGGSLPVRVRDQLGCWCPDEAFAPVYGVRGAPGISPAQLAVVTVLQFTENLTGRQAADAVRGRLDWKYCLGLELADPGFDFPVLSGFRSRLVAGGMEKALLDLLLARLGELGLAGAGMRQRTDATHVLARIRDLNRLELAGETVRAALEALAAAEPGWLAGIIGPSWQRVYGQRIDQIRLPEGKARRAELALQYARDGYWLLEQAWSPAAPPGARDLPAVRALRVIWVQQFCRESGPDGGTVMRREDGGHGLPPGRTRIISPYDLDARYSGKRGLGRAGYKGHFSGTCHGPAGDDPGTGVPALPNLCQVTCPQGTASRSWSPCRQHGTDAIVVKFPAPACGPCPARDKCTTSPHGRQLTPQPREIHETITAARAGQATTGWQQACKIRAGVEGTMAQATHVTGIRRARYLGLPKTTLEHNAAAAVNLIRLDAWRTATPLDRTRTSHLQRLPLGLAA